MQTTNDLLLSLMKSLNKKVSVDVKTIKKKVLILSTPRSGSSMFCDVLNNTGLLGECAEWFNSRYIAAYGKMKGNAEVQFNEYLTFVMEKTIRNTGVFVVNAHIEHLLFFAKNKNFNLLDLNFDTVIYLSRNNKLAQAVSLAKASHTDSWSSDVHFDKEKLQEITSPMIVNSLHHIVNSDNVYQNKLSKLTNAEFAYEDFVRLETADSYRKLFTMLDMKCPDNLQTNMTKQSDDFSKKALLSVKNYLLGLQ